uniref:CSON012839 protein n=1 Tax=Culicoides sonorensis TaxID=179676 RepID=A0A336M6K0_CULSO
MLPSKLHIGLLFLLITVCVALTPNYIKRILEPSVDPCYDDDRPKKCIPDFENAAFGVPVKASSICGQKGPQSYCNNNIDTDPNYDSTCVTCDESDPKRRYPAAALTDVNNSNNVTCWRSEPLPDTVNNDNVTLLLSLGKKFELTYLTLTFCPGAAKPDSLAIYKSTDYGRTFIPFQFYSSQCRKIYGRPNRAMITKSNEQEARCTDSHRHLSDATGISGSRIAFSVLDGRPSATDFDSSVVLQDWVTATDIKIVFHRFNMPQQVESTEDLMGLRYNVKKNSNDDDDDDGNSVDSVTTSSTFTGPTHQYAVSDFAVGGRCKCNGHAAHCLIGRDGQLACDCKHNTAGKDCEKCKPNYVDRPWGRATAREVNECKMCNCNGHARRCRFNMELFKLSGRQSGGVCLQCRHFTTGRHCHYCREGYYRDPTKPITSKSVCKRKPLFNNFHNAAALKNYSYTEIITIMVLNKEVKLNKKTNGK